MTEATKDNNGTPNILPQAMLHNISEEDIFAIALAEIKGDTQRPGLWAKALSESKGDKNHAQALYIRFRAEQLEQERVSQQVQKGRIQFKCPFCMRPRALMTSQVEKWSQNHNVMFQCPDCQRTFDIRSALPDLTLKVLFPAGINSALQQVNQSSQAKSGRIPFNCPHCGRPRTIKQSQVQNWRNNRQWKFKCPDCQQIFDLYMALPKLAKKNHARKCRASSYKEPANSVTDDSLPSPDNMIPDVSHFGPELLGNTIIIIFILALIFGFSQCHKFKMQKKISDAYRNNSSQYYRP